MTRRLSSKDNKKDKRISTPTPEPKSKPNLNNFNSSPTNVNLSKDKMNPIDKK